MAIANSYPMGTPKSTDLLLGTSVPVVGTDEQATTRNFSISAVATLATQGYLEVTKTISNAEWLALPTTSIDLIPAPGTGKVIKVLAATLKFNYATSSFFFPGDIIIGSGTTSANTNAHQCSLPGDGGAGGFDDIDGDATISLATKNAEITLNSPLRMARSTGTSGGGTLDVILRYQVI